MNFSCKTIVVAAGFAAVLGGCVSSGTYQQKEQESLRLSKSLDESRSSQAELQQKYQQLVEEHATLEASQKKLTAELGDAMAKMEKLAGSNSELVAELAASKSAGDKLGKETTELTDKLKKVAVNFVDSKSENDKLTLLNLSLSEKARRLAAEKEALQLANERLSTAAKPENLLKTVAEHFEALQQTVDGLNRENAKLKTTLLEMRGVGKRPQVEKSAPVSGVNGGAAADADKPTQEKVSKENNRHLPAAAESNQPAAALVEKSPPALATTEEKEPAEEK